MTEFALVAPILLVLLFSVEGSFHGDVPPRRSERDRQRGLPTWQLI
jgi:hypothetical protein